MWGPGGREGQRTDLSTCWGQMASPVVTAEADRLQGLAAGEVPTSPGQCQPGSHDHAGRRLLTPRNPEVGPFLFLLHINDKRAGRVWKNKPHLGGQRPPWRRPRGPVGRSSDGCGPDPTMVFSRSKVVLPARSLNSFGGKGSRVENVSSISFKIV